MSHFFLGLRVFVSDTRENPALALAALVVFVASLLVFVVASGVHL